jgi:hypothetical protein
MGELTLQAINSPFHIFCVYVSKRVNGAVIMRKSLVTIGVYSFLRSVNEKGAERSIETGFRARNAKWV